MSLLLVACTGGRAITAGSPTSTPLLPSARPLTQAAIDQEPIVAAVKRVAPAVVNVTTAVLDPNALLGGPDGAGRGDGIRHPG